MRLNVYSQELTDEVQLVKKTDANKKVYYGIRFILEGSPRLHNTPTDDDRQAITFWIPNYDSHVRAKLISLFDQAASIANQIN